MPISLQDVLTRLSPTYPNLLIGISVYLMMICSLVNMFLQKKPDTRISFLCTAVIILCLVDKVAVGPMLYASGLEVFLLRIPMFVAPLITAGMTRWDASRPWGVVGGLIGGLYLFSRWFFEMRGA